MTLVAAMAVFGCLALMAAVAYTLEARDLRARVDADLADQAALVATRLLTTGEVDEVLRGGALEVATTYVQVVAETGKTVPLSTARAVLPVDEPTRAVASGRGDRFYSDVTVDGSAVRVLAVPIAGGALQVARPVDDVNLHLVRVAGLVALTGLLGMALALVVGRLVAPGAPARQAARGCCRVDRRIPGLRPGQVEDAAAAGDLVGGRVQSDVAVRQDPVAEAGPPQERTQAGPELHERQGLGEVVVGPGVEPGDDVGDAVPDRQEDGDVVS